MSRKVKSSSGDAGADTPTSQIPQAAILPKADCNCNGEVVCLIFCLNFAPGPAIEDAWHK